MPARMTAIDAQFYWMSAKVPNDEFMLYVFDGVPTDFARAIDGVRERAKACRALTARVEDGSPLTYPRWVPTTVAADQVEHHHGDHDWHGCLDLVVRLAGRQLDIRRTPWRLHLLAPVHGVPGAVGPSTVAALQMPHALADGIRSAAMAARLFGRGTPIPEIEDQARGSLPWRGIVAAQAHRQLTRDVGAGLLKPPVGTRPPTLTNSRPAGERYLRTLVRHRSQLRGPTVTVAALAAVSGALAGHLDATELSAELPMAKPGVPRANNHFANVTIGLHSTLPPEARLQRIAEDLADARRRSEHPAALAADRAFAAVPAPLLRWGIGHFDPDADPAQVSGNTVVSSVYRGPADLRFGDVPVLLTAGGPSLSPAMGLVHGVHGIGDTVVVTVHAAESATHGIEDYLARLDAEL